MLEILLTSIPLVVEQDGDPALTQAASTTLVGAHGQYIENVHLEPYTGDDDFFARLYPAYRERLLGGAARFLAQTAELLSSPNDTMIFVRYAIASVLVISHTYFLGAVIYSAGFDASPHEHSYMSRHSRNVPTAFYTKFAQDVVAFAEKHARGRIVSVLEGGYSDWALMSASAAYISGLAAPDKADDVIAKKWWEPESLEKVSFILAFLFCEC